MAAEQASDNQTVTMLDRLRVHGLPVAIALAMVALMESASTLLWQHLGTGTIVAGGGVALLLFAVLYGPAVLPAGFLGIAAARFAFGAKSWEFALTDAAVYAAAGAAGSLVYGWISKRIKEREYYYGITTEFVTAATAAIFTAILKADIAAGGAVFALSVLGQSWLFENDGRSRNPRNLPLGLLNQVVVMLIAIMATGFVAATFPGQVALFALFPLVAIVNLICGHGRSLVMALTMGTLMVGITLLGNSPFGNAHDFSSVAALQIFLASLAVVASASGSLAARLPIRRIAIPLLAGALLAGSLFAVFLSNSRDAITAHLREESHVAMGNVVDRVDNFFALMRGIKGLFAASEYVDAGEWKTFIDNQQIHKEIPGAFAIALIRKVNRKNTASFLKEMREQQPAFPDIRSFPGTSTSSVDDHYIGQYVVQYVYPDDQPLGMLGVDLGTQAQRRELLQSAELAGKGTLSPAMPIITGSSGTSGSSGPSAIIGALAALPIPHIGIAGSNNDEQQESAYGFIAAPVNFADLMGTIPELSNGMLSLKLFHRATGLMVFSSQVSPRSVQNATFRDVFVHKASTMIAGQEFDFIWTPGPALKGPSPIIVAGVLGVSCLLVSLLLWVYLEMATREERTAAEVERKTAVVAEKEELWRVFTNSAPVGIYQVDSNDTCTYANPAWEKLAGVPKEKLQAEGWIGAIHPDDRDAVMSAAIKYKNNELEKLDIRFRFQHADGTIRHVHTLAAKVTGLHGDELGSVGITTDLTADLALQKQMEEERLRSYQSAKLASLGQMAGGIAHEINNPLMILAGNAATLRSLVTKKGSPEAIEKATRRIEDTVQRIARIVSGMRALTRGGDDGQMALVPLSDVIHDTIELCRQRFSSGGVDLRVNCDDSLKIMGRAGQIGQILLNLLNNAFDAVEGQNPATVTISGSRNPRKNAVELSVENTGPRIPDDVAARIMEPFFTTKDVGKGTGLGLSISKRIAEAHNGQLLLDQSCKNTRFILSLPHVKAEENQAA